VRRLQPHQKLVFYNGELDRDIDSRNRYEYQVLIWLAEALPAAVKVLIVADRGFGDHKLYRTLTEELKFDYLIRFRGNIKVATADGETRMATDWVGQRGRARILRGAAVTAEGYLVGAVVGVQAKDMKEPWCLATSLGDEKAAILLKKYSKRWGIECSFRDTKDPHFGMGMAQTRINSPERRDRLWLLNALAVALLTMLAPPVRLSDSISISKPAPPSGGHTPCSVRAACITTSFQPCRRPDCGPLWKSSPSSCSSNRFSQISTG
jgi:hypothetical protein